ncbi:efflux RND transporter permease subunit [Ketobacter sp.]|uniref:efflux RND transporter permease subunit n=1 Tax=Ketobacter sp. TaxID=2083498 RepID=UPI000F29DE0E|nr:efflux RND transporter permease subunit [Ketobacter sp.]RLU00671.1 MAG: efflux RND transporter permease subunit [Ketobacter sp.]
MSEHKGILATFATHRVASNLLMFLFILAGLWALKMINTQFFPSFELEYITISVPWSGASAEDVESSIIIPMEQELKTLTEVKKMTSTANSGSGSITLELEEGVDVGNVLDRVKQRVESIRNLPDEAERPVIQQVESFQPIANIVIMGSESLPELAQLARQFESELLARGIRKINFVGMPAEEIAIKVPSATLHETGLSLSGIAALVGQNSTDLPAGTAAKDEVSKQVRSLSQQRTVQGFEQMPLFTDSRGRLLRVGDIAEVERRPQEDEPYITVDGQPAIELLMMRTDSEDTLKTARIFTQWVDDVRPRLPEGVHIKVYNERWKHLRDRIQLLLENGISGLLLVIATLFLFLNVRVAFWVTVGIPVSFLATLAVLHLTGGTINMISLFALIMALGIIVDDAIVVGEDTLTHLEMGESAERASVGGARRMFAPVLASSMTTIAAFLPLALLHGVMGKIAFDLPVVIICVIIASVVECFLILPGHLNHSLRKQKPAKTTGFKANFDRKFVAFREQRLRPAVDVAIRNRGSVVVGGFCAFALMLSLVFTGVIKTTFFPAVDGNEVHANVEFHFGTAPKTVDAFLQHLEDSLQQTAAEVEEEYGNNILNAVITYHGRSFFNAIGREVAPELGAVRIDLVSGQRPISNAEFMERWRENIRMPPGINRFAMTQRDTGPSGKPIAIRLIGADVNVLKQASTELQKALSQYRGVSNIDDDLPWGKEQLIYDLTPTGRQLGLDTVAVGRQLRAAFDGHLAQIFNQNDEEIEVRVTLPDHERNTTQTLEYFPVTLANGTTVPLSDVVQFRSRKGIERLNHTNGQLNVTVSADLDDRIGNANEIFADLNAGLFPELKRRYGVEMGLEGKAQDQQETISEMGMGMLIGLALIFIVLSWVFASYVWPIAVMTAIPLGLTGSLIGHLLMGKDLSMFSMMGLFGLSGIVVNDSIVLITFFGQLRARGMDVHTAIVEAICARFRAVVLTSLTTVAGLLPILFETSLQAQFLIPMAISIVFGLAYGTFLILFFVPAMITYLEGGKRWIRQLIARIRPPQPT